MVERIGLTYRRARREDLPAMRLTQGLALRDLAAREGRDAPYMPLDDQPTPLMKYLARYGLFSHGEPGEAEPVGGTPPTVGPAGNPLGTPPVDGPVGGPVTPPVRIPVGR